MENNNNNEGIKLSENSVVLSLKIGKPGNNKKTSLDGVVVNSDKSMLHLSKELLDSPEYRTIVSFTQKVRKQILSLASPSFFREGMYLIPLPLLPKMEEMLTKLKEEIKPLIEKFLETYPEKVKEAKERLKDKFNPLDYPEEEKLLKDKFNPLDYPEKEKLRKEFYWEQRYLTLETPKKMESISISLYQEEAKKVEKFWEETATEVKDALRIGFSELLSHMVEKLGYDGDKPKSFKKNSIEHLTDFFETFSKRNILDDEELSLLVQKAKNVLNGVDIISLRKDLPFRDSIRKELEPIKQNLDSMLMDRPSRAISFEDD